MGDSDDEYDRRRVRDKFRGERSEYEQRRPRGDYRDRRDWGDRRGRDSWSGGRDQGWDRKRSGQYYGRPRRDSEGGDGQMSPPLKRNRRDWDSSYEKNFSSGVMPSPGLWSGGRGPLMQHQSGDSGKQGISESGGDFKSSQPPKMMTFKSFLIAQEDNIDEMEAVRRFQEYKTEFKRTQLSDFFVTHKDEEWFKNKYHPIDSKNQAKGKRNAVKKRLQIFLDILESGQMGDTTLDGSHSDAIMKLLDSVAIRLEEGASEDLDDKKSNSDDGKDSSAEEPKESKEAESKQEQIENEEDEPLSPSKVPLPAKPPPESQDKGDDHSSESESEAEPRPPGEDPVDLDKVEDENENGTVKSSRDDPEDEGETDPGPPGVDQYESKAESEGRNISDDSGNESERKRDKENSNNLDANHAVVENDDEKKETSAAPSEGESGKDKKDVQEKEEKSGKRDWDKKKRKGLGAFVSELGGEGNDDSDSDSDSESDEDEEDVEEKSEEQEVAKQQSESVGDKRNESTEIDESKDTEQEARESHKTLSLYMRSVPPNISKADIAAVCKRYPGYLRVALSDPSPERGFCRRGWVTFENNVNIKDICWNLSNIRIKDCELIPVVNRDLLKRIRPISGITLCNKVVRFDIFFSTKLIKALDEKVELYSKDADDEEKDPNSMDFEEQEKEENGEDKELSAEPGEVFARKSKAADRPLPVENPLLTELPEIVKELEAVDHVSADAKDGGDLKQEDLDFACDEQLIKTLDKLLMYLRVVHSVDYYNGTDYPYEDEMPNRCGILHVRGDLPEKATNSEVAEWKASMEQKLGHFLESGEERLSDEEIQKLGKKNSKEEVENFINANTQELAKEKWLCPLSGKKFRAKDFVVKHIHNKHADKLEAVRLEVEFFNNYLADPKRPHIPDSSPSRQGGGTQSGQSSYQQSSGHQLGWNPRGPVMMYGGPRVPLTPPNYGGNFAGGPDVYGRGGTYPTKVSRNAMMPRDSRKPVHYKDLDAPDDMDFF